MKKHTESGLFIGIDLGTTNSVVAVFEADGKPKVIPNADGDLLAPSVVTLRDEQHPVVGRAAVNQAAFAPEYTASLFKRTMGRVDAEGRPIPAFLHADSGKPYTPEELSSFVIRYLASGIAAATGTPVNGACISVPAYFESEARAATKRAGELAGVKVLQIVNEPTAAGLAFGLDGAIDGIYVVYDLGGGTFDITILEIQGGTFRVLATDGDRNLGGSDIDNLLVSRAVEAFRAQYGFEITPESDLPAFRELLDKAESAKKTLSQSDSASFVISAQGQRLQVDLTRRDFNELIAPIIDQTREIARRALEAAKVNVDQITDVLLVGGSTRIPAVREMLTSVFGKAPRTDAKPDEAVALGAAIYAAQTAGDAGLAVVDTQGQKVLPPNVTVKDVTSHSLGCLALRNGVMRNCVIIPANTPLPAEMKDRFALLDDNQTAAEVVITSGPDNADPADCIIYGRLTLSGLPPRPAGQNSIEVKYGYTVEGVLTVTITDLISGKTSSEVRRLTLGEQPGAAHS
jgi:molecular chaperone DnaK